jgi:hypothetical protein
MDERCLKDGIVLPAASSLPIADFPLMWFVNTVPYIWRTYLTTPNDDVASPSSQTAGGQRSFGHDSAKSNGLQCRDRSRLD